MPVVRTICCVDHVPDGTSQFASGITTACVGISVSQAHWRVFSCLDHCIPCSTAHRLLARGARAHCCCNSSRSAPHQLPLSCRCQRLAAAGKDQVLLIRTETCQRGSPDSCSTPPPPQAAAQQVCAKTTASVSMLTCLKDSFTWTNAQESCAVGHDPMYACFPHSGIQSSGSDTCIKLGHMLLCSAVSPSMTHTCC